MIARSGRGTPREGPELTVVIPAFCEAQHAGEVLDTWCTTLDSLGIDYVLCAYDDGSPDETLEILEGRANVREQPAGELFWLRLCRQK